MNYHDRPGSGSFLVVGSQRYQLTQFHFHRPSEERVQGKLYDMVLHLVHQRSDGAASPRTLAQNFSLHGRTSSSSVQALRCWQWSIGARKPLRPISAPA